MHVHGPRGCQSVSWPQGSDALTHGTPSFVVRGSADGRPQRHAAERAPCQHPFCPRTLRPTLLDPAVVSDGELHGPSPLGGCVDGVCAGTRTAYVGGGGGSVGQRGAARILHHMLHWVWEQRPPEGPESRIWPLTCGEDLRVRVHMCRHGPVRGMGVHIHAPRVPTGTCTERRCLVSAGAFVPWQHLYP